MENISIYYFWIFLPPTDGQHNLQNNLYKVTSTAQYEHQRIKIKCKTCLKTKKHREFTNHVMVLLILLSNKGLVIQGTLILDSDGKNVSFCWNLMKNKHTEATYMN